MPRVWIFDLDDTLHDASAWVMGELHHAMTRFVSDELGVSTQQADALRSAYWRRYGATLLGLVHHHGVDGRHFLRETHRLPGLESKVFMHPRDRQALRRLPGKCIVATNAPAAYARRVLRALGIAHCFDHVHAIDRMRMFGHYRPKPDRRMFRALLARLNVHAHDCVLVEDTLVHQRAARGLGMKTAWMTRYARPKSQKLEVGVHHARKPQYVCARIDSIQALSRRFR
jgi:putative hydrolase of the HAD superfamily